MEQKQLNLDGSKRRVVVIGGGVAGSLIAKTLQFGADVTLIDPKEYFEIPWASLRAKVEPSFAERSVINHRDYFINGNIVASAAIDITDTEVLTEEGRLIPYDYLVLATGHNDPVPKTRAKRLNQYETENEKIKSARSIVIVGGGPTGVELAAEIAADFPDKRITLVHRGSRLLEFVGPKAADKALNWLRSRKVEVKLQQSIVFNDISSGGNTFITSEGERIEADCHFVCIGSPSASSWLRRTILNNNLGSDGRLMVDENLRVKGRKNIFAVGDITDIQEMKQGYLAQKHAAVAAKNVKLLMAGENESKPASYKPCSGGIAIISLGRKDAVAEFPFTTIGGRLPGLIKSGDLFVGKTRKQLGLEPHAVNSRE